MWLFFFFLTPLLIVLWEHCLTDMVDPLMTEKNKVADFNILFAHSIFSWKQILNLSMVWAEVLRKISILCMLFSPSGNSPLNYSCSYKLVSCEDLCIETLFDSCFFSKHEINDSQDPLQCHSTLSVLSSVLLPKWLMQAACLTAEDGTAFGVSL